jgi:hypothetical protein
MKKVTLKQRATIINPEPFTVYDEFSNPYETVYKRQKGGHYVTTLRPGVYFLPGDASAVKFRPAKLPMMPAAQRHRSTKNLNVKYSDKATKSGLVNWKTGEVLLNPQLRNQHPAKRDFILFHELAHGKYKNESLCDLEAARRCNKKGDSLNKIIAILQETRPGSPTTQTVTRLLSKYDKK